MLQPEVILFLKLHVATLIFQQAVNMQVKYGIDNWNYFIQSVDCVANIHIAFRKLNETCVVNYKNVFFHTE